MISNISRLEQDVVDDHRLLTYLIGHGWVIPVPLFPPYFPFPFPFPPSVVDPCLARYGDGSCGRGAARSRWKARPSVLIGFVIGDGMLN